MIRHAFLLALATAMAALTLVGCYTVFRHPPLESVSSYQHGAYSECADCHDTADYYHYWIDPSYAYTMMPAPWAVGYDHTWWYVPYEHADPDGRPVYQGRHGWDRGPASELPRVGSRGIGVTGGARVQPLPPSSSPPPSDDSGSDDPPEQNDSGNDRGDTRKDDGSRRDDENPKRHGWRR